MTEQQYGDRTKKKHTATMRDNFRTLAAVQLNTESELFGGVR